MAFVPASTSAHALSWRQFALPGRLAHDAYRSILQWPYQVLRGIHEGEQIAAMLLAVDVRGRDEYFERRVVRARANSVYRSLDDIPGLERHHHRHKRLALRLPLSPYRQFGDLRFFAAKHFTWRTASSYPSVTMKSQSKTAVAARRTHQRKAIARKLVDVLSIDAALIAASGVNLHPAKAQGTGVELTAWLPLAVQRNVP